MTMFQKVIKPLRTEDMPFIERMMQMIALHLSRKVEREKDIVENQETITHIQLALAMVERGQASDISQTECEYLLAGYGADLTYCREQVTRSIAVASVLQSALAAFIAIGYHISPKERWHIDVAGGVLYRVPEEIEKDEKDSVKTEA